MRTKVLLGLAVALMLVVSVATIGSNMGFKISIPLKGGGASNWISLPYYQNDADLFALYNDILASVPSLNEVDAWDSVNNVFISNTGDPADPSPALQAGIAYMVKIGGADSTWICVGSHNPTTAVALVGGGASNWVSVPYHSTAANLFDLYNQLLAQIPSLNEVDAWDSTNNVFISNAGDPADPSPALQPGTGYMVKIGGATSAWTPAHY